MNAAEPIEAMPTDGHARGIVDESSSAQQISAGGDQSKTQAVETEAVEAEGDPEAAAAQGKAVVVPDDRCFLPQFRLCRDLLW